MLSDGLSVRLPPPPLSLSPGSQSNPRPLSVELSSQLLSLTQKPTADPSPHRCLDDSSGRAIGMSSSASTLPAALPTRAAGGLDRLANVELQLVMHHLPWRSLQTFAGCSKRLREAATEPFAFQYAHIACHGKKLQHILPVGLNALVRTLTPFNQLEPNGIAAIRQLRHLTALNMHAPLEPHQLHMLLYGTPKLTECNAQDLALQSLRSLQLCGSELALESFSDLAALPRLQRLSMLSCQGVTSVTLNLLQDLPALEELQYEPIEANRVADQPGVGGLISIVSCPKLRLLHLNLRAFPLVLAAAGVPSPGVRLTGADFLTHPGLLGLHTLVLAHVNLQFRNASDFADAFHSPACRWEQVHLERVEFTRPGDWSQLLSGIATLKLLVVTSPQDGFHPIHFVASPALEMLIARGLHAVRHRGTWLQHADHHRSQFDSARKKLILQVGWNDTPEVVRSMRPLKFNPLDY